MVGSGLEPFSRDVCTREEEGVLRAYPSETDALRRLKPLMERLITTPGSVPKEAYAPRKDRFANNRVHRPADRIFSVMAGNWSPGQNTQIPDHLTWAGD